MSLQVLTGQKSKWNFLIFCSCQDWFKSVTGAIQHCEDLHFCCREAQKWGKAVWTLWLSWTHEILQLYYLTKSVSAPLTEPDIFSLQGYNTQRSDSESNKAGNLLPSYSQCFHSECCRLLWFTGNTTQKSGL